MRLAVILVIILSVVLPAFAFQEQIRTEIPYQDGTVSLVSDSQERVTKTRYRAEGHVVVTFQDTVVTGDLAEYDDETREGFITGNVRFSQKQQWLSCTRAEFNFGSQTGVFFDATGYTDGEFFVTGRTIRKTGPDTYKAENTLVTACRPENPKWTLSASSATIHVDRTTRLHHTKFKIKGIPVFYAPYLIVPMEKKTRSSGFVPFQTGTSTSKGRVFSEGYYQTLGRSADVLVYGDYFTKRGLAVGGTFRARPNPATRFHLEAYGIKDKDKDDASGVQLLVDGETRLRDDWRGVARVNITSDPKFRQVFSDSFRAATVSQEKAIVFLSRNHESYSTNIAFQREEVFLAGDTVVTKKLPSIEFISLGTPLGRTPFILNFQTSFDGASRMDGFIRGDGTGPGQPQLVQRLDFYPALTMRLPELAGFSFVPSVGVRETYYGARLSPDSTTGIRNESLHRRYVDFTLDMKAPVLEKDFDSRWFGSMQHTVEPFATYRRIAGIENFNEIIRFDEQDVIADTNEVEYGIINRLFRMRETGSGTRQKREFMSFGLIQKYYFDPDFGGAFRRDQPNSFAPLNSVTGFYQTGERSTMAPLSAILQLSPQDGIHNDVRVDFDTNRGRLRNGSIATLWRQGRFFLSGTYFLTFRERAEEDEGRTDSNSVQAQIGYGSPGHGLSSSLTMSYNLHTGRMLNSQSRVTYTWDCCGVAVEFNQFDIGSRSETRFSLSFSLKGLGSFGNLRRPESLF